MCLCECCFMIIVQAAWFCFYHAMFGAPVGAVIMLTGNGILRAAGHSGYGSDSYVAVVGVIGGAISYPSLAFLGISIQHRKTSTYTSNGVTVTVVTRLFREWVFDFVRWMVYAIVTSVVGGSIMWGARHKIAISGPLDIRHALSAGVLGATIYLPLVIPWLWIALETVHSTCNGVYHSVSDLEQGSHTSGR